MPGMLLCFNLRFFFFFFSKMEVRFSIGEVFIFRFQYERFFIRPAFCSENSLVNTLVREGKNK